MIRIAQRLKPFSHTPGAACLLPGTCVIVEAFPTLLRIGEIEIPLQVTGPVRDFTLEQDLEKNCVRVFGKAPEGFYRICIRATDSGFDLQGEKGPFKSQHISAEFPFVPQTQCERLSLGSHRKQDWDAVQKRADLREFLPILFCLGQKIPHIPAQSLSGTARLLEWPEERIRLAPALEAFFKAAFRHIFVPRLRDDQYQGLAPDEPAKGSPCFLIQEGAKQIRALFFHQNERRLAFLPRLPIPLDAGRLIGLKVPGVGEIDFEWSKKVLRRVLFRASTSGEVVLELQPEIRTFRVGKKLRKKRDEPLLLEAGKTYLLDRFER